MTNRNEHQKLAESIELLDKKTAKRFSSVDKSIQDTKEELMSKLQPVHDFMIDQQGFFRGQQSGNDNDLSTVKELIKTIAILAGVIVMLAGIYQVTK